MYIIEEVFPETNQLAWINIVRMHSVALPEDIHKLPDEGYWFMARPIDTATPVAFAGLIENGVTKIKRKNAKIGMLVRAGVLESHRGHGLQKQLIEARIQKALTLNYKVLYSSTYENPVSSNNLIACGFRMFTPDSAWGIDGTNYWRLFL